MLLHGQWATAQQSEISIATRCPCSWYYSKIKPTPNRRGSHLHFSKDTLGLQFGQCSVVAIHSWALLIFLQAWRGGHVRWHWLGPQSPFPLSFACHNTGNITAMSRMWFCFLPLHDHICCCPEMPLCGNVLLRMLSGTAVLFVCFIGQIWLGDGKLGLLQRKHDSPVIPIPLPTKLWYLHQTGWEG